MRTHGRYKHVNCTDAAIECLRCVFVPEKEGYAVKVSWLNVVNPNNVFPCGLIEEIFIPATKIREWGAYE